MNSTRSSLLLGSLLGLGAALLILGILLVLFFVRYQYSNSRVLHGVVMEDGTNLSGRTFPEASELLLRQADLALHSKLTVAYEDQEVEFTPRELGVHYDIDRVVADLRDLSSGDYSRQLSVLLYGTTIPYPVSIDTPTFQQTILSAFEFSLELPQDATITYNESRDQFIIKRGSEGNSVNLAEFYKALHRYYSSPTLDPQEQFQFTLKSSTVPPRVTYDDATSLLADISPLLESPVTLVVGDKEIILEPELLRSWTVFTPPLEADGHNPSVLLVAGFNAELVRAEFEQLTPEFGDPPRDARLGLSSSGEVIVVEEGRSGLTITTDEHLDEFEEKFFNGSSTISLEPTLAEPRVTSANLKELGLIDRIGTGSTDYTGSPADRMHNIAVGAKRFDKILLAPGEEFSFNTFLGSADAKDGYVNAFVIRGKDIVPSLGGGLCQVSTTAFRAAAYTGLDITERWPHSFHVSYYGDPGFDATIWLGGKDFRFINDTNGHLYIQTSIKNAELTFEFYGTPDDRIVNIDGPRITHKNPNGSMYTELDREVVYADGNSSKDSYTSFYQPRSSFQTPEEKAKAEEEQRKQEEEDQRRQEEEQQNSQ